MQTSSVNRRSARVFAMQLLYSMEITAGTAGECFWLISRPDVATPPALDAFPGAYKIFGDVLYLHQYCFATKSGCYGENIYELSWLDVNSKTLRYSTTSTKRSWILSNDSGVRASKLLLTDSAICWRGPSSGITAFMRA